MYARIVRTTLYILRRYYKRRTATFSLSPLIRTFIFILQTSTYITVKKTLNYAQINVHYPIFSTYPGMTLNKNKRLQPQAKQMKSSLSAEAMKLSLIKMNDNEA